MPGMKFDKEKPRWDLLPLDAVGKIVEIMTYGAGKYKPNNWQKVEAWRYHAALLRHLEAIDRGEDYDKESGMLHIAHVGCNVIFLIWKKLHDKDSLELHFHEDGTHTKCPNWKTCVATGIKERENENSG